MTVTLDETGCELLSGLVGKRYNRTARVRLDDLDAALRRSAAAAGLISITEALHGPLVDRKALRAARTESRHNTAALLDAALAGARLSDQQWVPAFLDGIRLAGILSKAGEHAATAIEHAGTALRELAATGALTTEETGSITSTNQVTQPPRSHATPWGLAEFATRCTGDAHGLDPGRVAAALVLRAASAALGLAPPESAIEARNLWSHLGVTPDELSGTVLVWALRPPGTDAWSRMMRDRADLGLVTHLTLHELRGVASHERWADPNVVVSMCENPQVLQTAARNGSDSPLVCTSGNPATAGWLLVQRLIEQHVQVRYHGDFDWPGIAIANRIISAGTQPWLMSADDYSHAIAAVNGTNSIPLTGKPAETPWDPQLAETMRRVGIAVHEEALLHQLLTDL